MNKTAPKGGQKKRKTNFIELAQGLRPFEKEFAFLPCNNNKVPPIRKWQLKSFSIDEIFTFNFLAAIGVRTQVGNLLCIDIDGITAVDYLYERNLIPQHCKTWQVHRSNHDWKMKLLFKLTPDQIQKLHSKDINESRATGASEQLEIFFYGGRQVIILGEHPSGGQYFSPRGFDIDAVTAPPDDWMELIIEASKGEQAVRRGTSNSKDWTRLDFCPVCKREQNPICNIHKDGNTLRCFHGGTHYPPKDLKKGQIVAKEWAFSSKELSVGIGIFSNFVKHQPTPIQKLWSLVDE
tara:strand:+ start:679 stop:1557 length:879 start_codon:yes stop_codon:yes gene_type:complete